MKYTVKEVSAEEVRNARPEWAKEIEDIFYDDEVFLEIANEEGDTYRIAVPRGCFGPQDPNEFPAGLNFVTHGHYE